VCRFVASRLDGQQRLPRRHLLTAAREHFLDHTANGRLEADLHLHRLEQPDGLARLHLVSRSHVDRNHHGGRSGLYVSGQFVAKAVGAAFDFHAQAAIGRVV
jgi:hypothetical protein